MHDITLVETSVHAPRKFFERYAPKANIGRAKDRRCVAIKIDGKTAGFGVHVNNDRNPLRIAVLPFLRPQIERIAMMCHSWFAVTNGIGN